MGILSCSGCTKGGRASYNIDLILNVVKHSVTMSEQLENYVTVPEY